MPFCDTWGKYFINKKVLKRKINSELSENTEIDSIKNDKTYNKNYHYLINSFDYRGIEYGNLLCTFFLTVFS